MKDFNVAIQMSPMNGEGYYYRGFVLLNEVSGIEGGQNNDRKTLSAIKSNLDKIDTACEDFKKAKNFRYSIAIEAIETYCKGS